jgi:hypothetical protein
MTVSQSMPPSQFGMQHAIPVSDDILTAIGATVVCHSFVEAYSASVSFASRD